MSRTKGGWREIEVTFVGILGLVISLAAAPFVFPHRYRERFLLGYLFLALHLAATVVNFTYSQSHDADAKGYFLDPLGISWGPTAFGTTFVVKLVQWMRHAFGGSYFEYFLFFQAIGFLGIVILSRSLSEIEQRSRFPLGRSSVGIFLLPSMHFWTCSIGKDAPLFLACGIAAWSMLKLSSRWVWFVAAIAVMVVFRPHIAVIAVISLMLALVFDSRYEIIPRLLFFAVALAACSYLVGTVGRTFSFDASDPNAVADFFTSQQSMSELAPGTTTMQGGGFVVKLLSLMFRPMFFDAHGLFGIITSVENVIFLFGLVYLIMYFKDVIRILNVGIYFKYSLFFTVIFTVLMTVVYYNVGLGLRQRVMVYPTLLPMFVAAWAVWSARRRGRAAMPPPPLGGRVLASAPPHQHSAGVRIGPAGSQASPK